MRLAHLLDHTVHKIPDIIGKLPPTNEPLLEIIPHPNSITGCSDVRLDVVLADARLAEAPYHHTAFINAEAKTKNALREIRPHRLVNLRQSDRLESSRV